ncbi:MAG: carbohydrate binding family 9 domain-containing protein [Gemmatimonadaceae bacterium]|nr:carbohydrate binding family 9 domain-containing protein [Gemmatimonadaceae bacterium]
MLTHNLPTYVHIETVSVLRTPTRTGTVLDVLRTVQSLFFIFLHRAVQLVRPNGCLRLRQRDNPDMRRTYGHVARAFARAASVIFTSRPRDQATFMSGLMSLTALPLTGPRSRPGWLLVSIAVVAGAPVAAQGGPVVLAVRASGAIVIDGRPDEPTWSRAPVFDRFIQQVPTSGADATARTEVQVLFDDEAMYVGVKAHQPPGLPIIADELRRDAGRMHYRNDTFTIALDTFFDRRNGYVLYINPLGAMADWAVWDEGRVWSQDWDSVWEARTAIHDWGWSAEIRLPFRSVRFSQPGPQTWGINLRRIVLGNNEWSYAAAVPPEWGAPAIGKFSSAGVLRGLEIERAGLNLEISPYLLGGASQAPCVSGACRPDGVGDIGLDAKYLLTPNLTLDATYNTDFSQVEADEQQVNLTRFSLFFPEKRQFFQEGKGIFDFGVTTGDYLLLPFFSRRVGIEGGQAVRLQGGARLTGKVGAFSVGALALRSDGLEGDPGSTFTVARVRRDILRRSSVGVIAVDRRASGVGNSVFGADAHLAFRANARVESFFVTSSRAETSEDASAGRLRVSNDTDRFGAEVDYLRVGRDFDPEAGYVRRVDIARWYGRLQASPRPSAGPVRQWFAIGSLDYVRTGAGRLETRDTQAQLRFDFHSADQIQIIAARRFDAPARPFRVARTLTIAPGAYGFTEVTAAVTLAPQRRGAGRVQYRGGGYYGGSRHELTMSSTVKSTRHLQADVNYQISRVRLPAGDAVTHLTGVRVSHSATTRVFTSALVQWNSSTRVFDTNVRFNWIYRPGSDVYVVFGRTSEDRERAGEFVGQSLVIKITRLLQF